MFYRAFIFKLVTLAKKKTGGFLFLWLGAEGQFGFVREGLRLLLPLSVTCLLGTFF